MRSLARGRGRRSVLAAAVLVGLLGGCTGGSAGPAAAPRVPAGHPADAVDAPYRLTAFTSCTDLIRRLKAAAKNSVGPYGFPDTAYGGGVMYDAPVAAAPAAREAPAHSDTNTQEAGVNEPDVVKTDGRRIVLLTGNWLRVVDVATHRVTGSLRLDDMAYGGQLLLSGDRALVFGSPVVARPAVRTAGPLVGVPYAPQASISLVDLSGKPKLVSTLRYSGAYLDARQVGSVARVVLTSRPAIQFPFGPPDRTDQQRIAANRFTIERTGVDPWLPQYSLTTGGRTTQGRLPCESVRTPQRFSGTSMLSVLTFDLGQPLGTGAPVGLAADGDAVYATDGSLYVSNNPQQVWYQPAGGNDADTSNTEIYQFDIAGSGPPVFVASGQVPGRLIGSYAMSEYGGSLRVASTTSPPRGPRAAVIEQSPSTGSSSAVTVLTRAGGALRVTGSVGGLGKDEQVEAVRYAGPVAYVVTFRQTDPLYVVDLRDAAHPRVSGELKLPGFSAYLHPLDGNRLLGVGIATNPHGATPGLQVGLFDVADPARPVRTAVVELPDRYPSGDTLAHAFLYWPATNTVVLPIGGYPDAGPNAGGFLVLRPDGPSLVRRGMLPVADAHGEGDARRALVVGNTLWTLSYTNLTAWDLGTLARQARVDVTP